MIFLQPSSIVSVDIGPQDALFPDVESTAERLLLETSAPSSKIGRLEIASLIEVLEHLGPISSWSNGSQLMIWFSIARTTTAFLDIVQEMYHADIMAILNSVVDDYTPVPAIEREFLAGPYLVQMDARALAQSDALIRQYGMLLDSLGAPGPIATCRRRLGV